MSNLPWFYHPFTHLDEHFLLEGTEVKHMLSARRLQAGDELILSNGAGKLAHCRLLEADKKRSKAQLKLVKLDVVTRSKQSVHLACALAKGDRSLNMLDMACQLGMTYFTPLSFQYSVSRFTAKLHAKFKRVAIESAKQCKQAFTPEIHDAQPFMSFIEQLAALNPMGHQILIADQSAQRLQSCASSIESAQHIYLLVGPEGGFSEPERKTLEKWASDKSNVHWLALSESILRIETATVAGLAAINQFK